ncbi:hypothetical protein RintRC_6557 [Richelia intracellularis]|nr:hypothetical protein RintRC_6557 [Richelia intracellularis]
MIYRLVLGQVKQDDKLIDHALTRCNAARLRRSRTLRKLTPQERKPVDTYLC